MKKFIQLFVILGLLVISTESIHANVYASGIRISDDSVTNYELAGSTWDGNMKNGGVKIWFVINENGGGALSATVTVKQGATTIRTLTVPTPAKGVNSIIWDGFNQAALPTPTGTYSFEINVADAAGHTTFDSLWVAGAYYQGNDFDGGTGYAYRGNATITDQSSEKFGCIYVSRGTSAANGLYELRADGEYQRKIATSPIWVGSVPNEVATLGNNVYALVGYGYGVGQFRNYNAVTGDLNDSSSFNHASTRDLVVRIEGTDTVFYTARGGTAGLNAIVKKVGILGDTVTYINMQPYLTAPTTLGYIKALKFDDNNNLYVAFGDASASRKKLAKFDSSGNLVWLKTLDTDFGLPASAYISSVVVDKGKTLNVSDDMLYILIYAGSQTAAERGIYQVQLDGSGITQLTNTGARVGTGATSIILNVDPAGNIIFSNGNVDERIMIFSPASGPNSFTTANPTVTNITITTVVPVELTSFNAKVNGKAVELSWTTATETNNNGFEVERKINNAWEKIGFVQGQGTTTQTASYSYTDENISAAKLEYRLKQIDFDGSYSYSKVVEVTGLISSFELMQNYPNPFNPTTEISFTIPVDTKVKLEIFSVTGELVEILSNEFLSAGKHIVKFNASGYASGTYIYRLNAGNVVLSKKMILMK